jgi:hypothetical protein
MQAGHLRTESSEYLCKIIVVLKKESVCASMGKVSFTRGVNHYWQACNNTEKHYYEVEPLGVCSISWKKQIMVVCMQYAKGTLQVY